MYFTDLLTLDTLVIVNILRVCWLREASVFIFQFCHSAVHHLPYTKKGNQKMTDLFIYISISIYSIISFGHETEINHLS